MNVPQNGVDSSDEIQILIFLHIELKVIPNIPRSAAIRPDIRWNRCEDPPFCKDISSHIPTATDTAPRRTLCALNNGHCHRQSTLPRNESMDKMSTFHHHRHPFWPLLGPPHCHHLGTPHVNTLHVQIKVKNNKSKLFATWHAV